MYVSCTIHHLPSGVRYKSDFTKMTENEFNRFKNMLKNIDELANLNMSVRSNVVFIAPNVLKESVITLRKSKWGWTSWVKNVIAKLFYIQL